MANLNSPYSRLRITAGLCNALRSWRTLRIPGLQEESGGIISGGGDQPSVGRGESRRVWREYRKLTQSQLAEKTGVIVAHISQIEGGKRECSVKLLRALAGALDVDVGMLLSGDENG
jgi:DNA-binding XRE family transcriptional regulator